MNRFRLFLGLAGLIAFLVLACQGHTDRLKSPLNVAPASLQVAPADPETGRVSEEPLKLVDESISAIAAPDVPETTLTGSPPTVSTASASKVSTTPTASPTPVVEAQMPETAPPPTLAPSVPEPVFEPTKAFRMMDAPPAVTTPQNPRSGSSVTAAKSPREAAHLAL